MSSQIDILISQDGASWSISPMLAEQSKWTISKLENSFDIKGPTQQKFQPENESVQIQYLTKLQWNRGQWLNIARLNHLTDLIRALYRD